MFELLSCQLRQGLLRPSRTYEDCFNGFLDVAVGCRGRSPDKNPASASRLIDRHRWLPVTSRLRSLHQRLCLFRSNRSLGYASTMIDESLLAKVASLSPEDRLEFIGAVWDTLSLDDLPLTDSERALLDTRLADIEAHPEDQSPWPEVKARLERLIP